MHIPIPTRLTWRGELVRQHGFMKPTQLGLPFYGKTILVDGIHDPQFPGIQYWGKATHVFDDVYACLANLDGTLCVVEVRISFHVGPQVETLVKKPRVAASDG